MKKKYIKVPKNYFKKLKFKIKIVPHSTEKICVCPDCVEMWAENERYLRGLKVAT